LKKIVLLVCLALFCFGQDVQQLEKACNNKNYDSCLKIAKLYINDDNVTRDYNKAFTYAKIACDNKKFEACDILGVLYLIEDGVGQDYDKAIEYFTKACDGEYTEACGMLGFMYKDIIGMEDENYKKAAKYHEKACDGGYAESCFDLGVMHRLQLGFRKDTGPGFLSSLPHDMAEMGKARKYYKKACDLGYEDGCYAYNELGSF